MQFTRLAIADVIEIVPQRRGDERGWFAETFREDLFEAQTGPIRFVQENESLSRRQGTIRGLHFQTAPFAQGKLVRCTAGAIFDVAVDLRHGSPGFGRWVAATLSQEKGNQLWIPAGFAHGFCTLTGDARVAYKVTARYSAEHDKGLAWDDPALGIEWPAEADPATLSDKDRRQPLLADLPAHFAFESA